MGNLIFERTGNVDWAGSDYQYNELNQLVQRVDSGIYTYTFEYDGRGNLQAGYKEGKIEEAYHYDATNRMAKGMNKYGETSEYLYNGLGELVGQNLIIVQGSYGYNRSYYPNVAADPMGEEYGAWSPTQKQLIAIDFVLDYTEPLTQVIQKTTHKKAGRGQLVETVSHGLEAVSVTVRQHSEDGSQNELLNLFFHHDRQGSIDFISENTGTVLSYTKLDDWGEPVARTKMSVNGESFAFSTYTRHPYDEVIGVYYARARMYDAENRHWMAMDPIKSGLNWYVYVGDNPITYWDPDGQFYIKATRNNDGSYTYEAVNQGWVNTGAHIVIDAVDPSKGIITGAIFTIYEEASGFVDGNSMAGMNSFEDVAETLGNAGYKYALHLIPAAEMLFLVMDGYETAQRVGVAEMDALVFDVMRTLGMTLVSDSIEEITIMMLAAYGYIGKNLDYMTEHIYKIPNLIELFALGVDVYTYGPTFFALDRLLDALPAGEKTEKLMDRIVANYFEMLYCEHFGLRYALSSQWESVSQDEKDMFEQTKIKAAEENLRDRFATSHERYKEFLDGFIKTVNPNWAGHVPIDVEEYIRNAVEV